jgi:hypothetical protein
MFRLNTGHDCLAAHLNKVKIYETEECELCKQQGSRMDRYHLQSWIAKYNKQEILVDYTERQGTKWVKCTQV